MRVRIAYVEEPPFYWTGQDGTPTGADIELAEVVLSRIGATAEYLVTPFEDLLTGVAAGRWDMNVPIFVTPERSENVAFSFPVWSLGDGFVVQRGNPRSLTSYAAVLAGGDARLGVIPGQVQLEAASAAGVTGSQIVTFTDQPSAVAALLAGEIDAFAATAVGNRVIAAENPELEAVDHAAGSGTAPVGAFSVAPNNTRLLQAVNTQLRAYLGTAGHRARMAKYGIAQSEIDPVL